MVAAASVELVDPSATAAPSLHFGFHPTNRRQLACHFLLAVGIGVSLRLTTFPEATVVALRWNDYQAKTRFLVSFGFTKALSNLLVGRISDVWGRRLPHAVGWGFGVVLGLLLLGLVHGTDDRRIWRTYLMANVFLGAQQGFTWTTNIFLWMDVLGSDHRALASGISNSVGYLTSALTTYVAAAVTTEQAFFMVTGTCLLGCFVSLCLVNDTMDFLAQEVQTVLTVQHTGPMMLQELVECPSNANKDTQIKEEEERHIATISEDSTTEDDGACFRDVSDPLQGSHPTSTSSFASIFWETSWRNPSAAVLCWGGLTTNLVTSLAWGLVLIWGQQQHLDTLALANVGSAFTFSKGIAMIVSGYWSDRLDRRKPILVGGFLVAAMGLLVTAWADGTTDSNAVYRRLCIGGIVIGSGIGSVYCILTAGLSDHTPPQNRATAIGVYKFWRDSGYAFGGLLTGWIADATGGSFVTTAAVVAGLVVALVLCILGFYKERTRTAVVFQPLAQNQ